jgi:hypothetical protein
MVHVDCLEGSYWLPLLHNRVGDAYTRNLRADFDLGIPRYVGRGDLTPMRTSKPHIDVVFVK